MDDDIDTTIKTLGDWCIVLADSEGNQFATTVTLHDLIDYVHETGACSSRHAQERNHAKA